MKAIKAMYHRGTYATENPRKPEPQAPTLPGTPAIFSKGHAFVKVAKASRVSLLSLDSSPTPVPSDVSAAPQGRIHSFSFKMPRYHNVP